ncbi:replication protein A 70 kDa DNA-binding subunit D-like [Andrographis paniculata]|uniref:replication protein A 70 kDa DNA-binding subunit D-like n=1 Tax=Andrographis paniculata TaxID=175694 RepID=UPI0021E837E8|nr:replication protein A 70 kDa DNA-binding subunit D-like [Andrographis paniculata]
MLPTRLTLWNELVDAEGKYFTSIVKERPIIAALHLKATLYAGISLSAISMANFIVDPPYPEADNLLSWKLNNKQGEYKIKGCLSIKVDKKVQLHYNACDKCYTSTPAPTARQFFCLRCKSVQSSEQKSILRLQIVDQTGSITCVAYDNIAQQILNFDIPESNELGQQEIISLCNLRNQELENQSYLFHIKKKAAAPSQTETHTYTLMSASKENKDKEIDAEETLSNNYPIVPKHTGITPEMQEKATCTTATLESSVPGKYAKNLLPLFNELESINDQKSKDQASTVKNSVAPPKESKK